MPVLDLFLGGHYFFAFFRLLVLEWCVSVLSLLEAVERYEKVKSRYDVLAEAIEEKQAHYEKLGIFIQTLEEHGELIAEFDAGMWGSMAGFITVDRDKNMTVIFKDGSEIAV